MLESLRYIVGVNVDEHRPRCPSGGGVSTRLDIETWPSATVFEAGSQLIVEILGHDADRYPALRHGDTVNSGAHTIYTGRLTPSALVFNALP